VAGLVLGDLLLLVDHHQSGVGAARADLAGDGEADDPGADHRDVVLVLNSLTHVRTHP
jgi:hypothetical protein